MRIAVWHNLPSGGGKRALHDHVRGLLARGHAIEAWCPSTADLDYLPLSELIPEHVLPLAWPGRNGLSRVLRLPGRVERELAAMEDHCRAAAAAIAAGGFDILVAHSCKFFRTSPMGRLTGRPSVLYQQEPYRWLYEALPRLPWLTPLPHPHPRLSPRWMHAIAKDRRVLRNARLQGAEEVRNAGAFGRILVNSLFSRESILRAYGRDAEVCYLGADLSRFVDRGMPRERFVIGLGTFSAEKRVGLAIEALALLPEPRPTLVWVGNASYGGCLEEMTALAAARGVPFTPHLRIPDEQVVELLNRAAALIYAPRLEPFGLAPIEAGACGLPVIAVAEGGVRETVIDGENGMLVHSSPRALADALAALLEDPALARRLGAAGRAHAERRWSLEASTDRIEAALLRAAGQDAGRYGEGQR